MEGTKSIILVPNILTKLLATRKNLGQFHLRKVSKKRGKTAHLRKVSKKTWLYSSDQTRYLLSRPDIVALRDVDDAAEGVGYHEDGILHIAEGEFQLAAHRTEHSPIPVYSEMHAGGCRRESVREILPVLPLAAVHQNHRTFRHIREYSAHGMVARLVPGLRLRLLKDKNIENKFKEKSLGKLVSILFELNFTGIVVAIRGVLVSELP